MGQQSPVFSVVLTTCNRAHLLPRAVQSVICQTFEDFELIVVDDASTDATDQVVASFSDSRIRFLRQVVNQGVGPARNLGIENASGEYVVFVDDDDTISPSFLAEVYTTFSQAPAKVGFLWTWKDIVQQTETGVRKLKQITYGSLSDAPIPGAHLLHKIHGGSGGSVMRAASLRLIGGFNTELRAAGDAELFIRLANHFDYIILPRPLYQVFAVHGERLTTPSVMRAQAIEHIIELHYDLLRKYPGSLRVLLRGSARLYYQLGKRQVGRHLMRRLIGYEPLQWRNWILLMLYENLNRLPRKLRYRLIKHDTHV